VSLKSKPSHEQLPHPSDNKSLNSSEHHLDLQNIAQFE